MKVRGISIFSIIALVLALVGCQTIPEEHRGAATGAGIGAATGAAAGAVLGDSTRATVLGGLAGALIGGAVGHFTVDKEKDAEATAQKYNYQPTEGTRVRIEETGVQPQVARPGEKVKIQSTYALLSPNPDDQVPITESFEIRHNGQLVGNPQTTIQHDAGTFEAAVPLFLPENAESGVYEVVTKISTPESSDTRVSTFSVR